MDLLFFSRPFSSFPLFGFFIPLPFWAMEAKSSPCIEGFCRVVIASHSPPSCSYLLLTRTSPLRPLGQCSLLTHRAYRAVFCSPSPTPSSRHDFLTGIKVQDVRVVPPPLLLHLFLLSHLWLRQECCFSWSLEWRWFLTQTQFFTSFLSSVPLSLANGMAHYLAEFFSASCIVGQFWDCRNDRSPSLLSGYSYFFPQTLVLRGP